MNQKEMIEKLISLAQLDIDAVHAYGQAIEQIELPVIREHMMRYRDDHRRHVKEIADVLRDLGGQPPDFSPDFKGFVISGFTSLRSMSGTPGALKAMHSNERLTSRKYEEARGLDWSSSKMASDLIAKNYQDERRHLEYLETAIENKAWENLVT